jgi:hypothetical protein
VPSEDYRNYSSQKHFTFMSQGLLNTYFWADSSCWAYNNEYNRVPALKEFIKK